MRVVPNQAPYARPTSTRAESLRADHANPISKRGVSFVDLSFFLNRIFTLANIFCPSIFLRPSFKGKNFMAYAVIQTGGKQYRVESGNEIEVEKLDVEPGAALEISEVLLVSDGSNLHVGTPFVDGASVKVTVVDQFKDDKVIAFKFRRRKGYHRTVGHRRRLTTLKIESISTK
jgi:large subunit ribosomal protein L21